MSHSPFRPEPPPPGRSLLRWPGLLAAILLLSACAVLQQLVQAPAVAITDMRLGKVGLFEQVLEFELKLDNPNAFALPMAGMEYTLELAGIEIGRGTQREAISVPALGQARWPVSFEVNSLKLIQSLMERQGRFEQLDYRIQGRFLLSEDSRLPPIPFDRRGEIGGS